MSDLYRVAQAAERFVDEETPATRSELFRAVLAKKEADRRSRDEDLEYYREHGEYPK